MSPKKITFALLCICVLIDFPPIFQYSAYDSDYYFDVNDGDILQTYKVYFLLASEISSSHIGSSIQIAIFVIRDGITLVFSIILNIICFFYMKNHSAKKQKLTNDSSPRAIVIISSQIIDLKKEREKTFQKNVSQMTITLVIISSLVRVTTLTCGIYWLFAYDLIAAILGVSADTAIALNATVPFFVYLRFNRKYRRIFLDLVLGLGKKRHVTGMTNSQSNRADQYTV